jgi:hypothetical protein
MRSSVGFHLGLLGGGFLGLVLAAGSACAIDLASHRANYNVSLGSAKPGSGVVAVDGSMTVETAEACDGWTTEQRNKFTIHYAEDNPDLVLNAVFVSWESKDGLHFRFSQREMKNGELDKEVNGVGELGAKDAGGTVTFTKPSASTLDLAPGVLFPTAHTVLLIERAIAGEGFVGAKVFDGTSDDNANDVTAVIGAPQDAAATAAEAVKSPLLRHRSWRVHLAFFPADLDADKPDFELTMRLLDNGVSGDSLLDYGDFAIKAKLEQIEVLPRPSC